MRIFFGQEDRFKMKEKEKKYKHSRPVIFILIYKIFPTNQKYFFSSFCIWYFVLKCLLFLSFHIDVCIAAALIFFVFFHGHLPLHWVLKWPVLWGITYAIYAILRNLDNMIVATLQCNSRRRHTLFCSDTLCKPEGMVLYGFFLSTLPIVMILPHHTSHTKAETLDGALSSRLVYVQNLSSDHVMQRAI